MTFFTLIYSTSTVCPPHSLALAFLPSSNTEHSTTRHDEDDEDDNDDDVMTTTLDIISHTREHLRNFLLHFFSISLHLYQQTSHLSATKPRENWKYNERTEAMTPLMLISNSIYTFQAFILFRSSWSLVCLWLVFVFRWRFESFKLESSTWWSQQMESWSQKKI